MEAVFVHLALSIFGQRMLASSHQFDLLYFSTIFQIQFVSTLASGIDVGQGINVGLGKFGKKE